MAKMHQIAGFKTKSPLMSLHACMFLFTSQTLTALHPSQGFSDLFLHVSSLYLVFELSQSVKCYYMLHVDVVCIIRAF